MVTSVTNLGRSGLSDWLLQRVTALVLLAYFVFVVGFLLTTPELSYEKWKALFECTAMRVFSMATLLSICMHAWIGLWAVSTDYLTAHTLTLKAGSAVGSKAMLIRLVFQAAYTLIIFTYLVWGVQVLWGM